MKPVKYTAFLILVLAVLPLMTAHAQLSTGIYAEFHTSMGGITARLDYVNAPMTVANFIGLTEGTQTWYEENQGYPRNDPFYDGTIVNRIADLNREPPPALIIQAGSRNGSNSGGGPGYTFRDEFSSLIHGPGTLSMANSGKNSNGSQFFFSLAPQSHLDGVHTIFGQVISGMDILTNISSVVLVSNKPMTNVVFNQIRILRIGEAASNFVVSAHGLPIVTNVPTNIDIVSNNTQVCLGLTAETNCQYVFCTATNLNNWKTNNTLLSTDIPVPTSHYHAVTSPPRFYSTTRVDYQDHLLTPSTAHGYRFLDANHLFDIQLSSSVRTGVVHFYDGLVTAYATNWTWTPDAYRGQIFLNFSNFQPSNLLFVMCFTNDGVNDYSGSAQGRFTYSNSIPQP